MASQSQLGLKPRFPYSSNSQQPVSGQCIHQLVFISSVFRLSIYTFATSGSNWPTGFRWWKRFLDTTLLEISLMLGFWRHVLEKTLSRYPLGGENILYKSKSVQFVHNNTFNVVIINPRLYKNNFHFTFEGKINIYFTFYN